jgi:hypothetical protein
MLFQLLLHRLLSRNCIRLVLVTAASCSVTAFGGIRVPAFTAYIVPDPEAAEVSESTGVTAWTGPAQKVVWFGELKSTGDLTASIRFRLPKGNSSKFRLTVGEQSRVQEVIGAEKDVVTAFGSYSNATPGYQRFTLESLNTEGQPNAEVDALLLDGPAIEGAHFNLLPRRNAASVHLVYPQPAEAEVDAFYCEMTGLEDPVWTYYMACGWHRGYFGMQVNSPTERRIIFSVWDSGREAVDRSKVESENRVTLVKKGEGVVSGDFGNEGTGGHSHWVYPWKTGERQRFLVTAQPTDATHTIYSGFYFHPEKKAWIVISSWRAPKEGGYLHGLYSFSENFGGSNGHLRRKALYGNQWIHIHGARWTELTTATFSHDPTGRADRLDRFFGIEGGEFFLSHGGFVPGFSKYGEKLERTGSGLRPSDFVWPESARP